MAFFEYVESDTRKLHIVEFLVLYVMLFSIIVCSAVLCYAPVHTREVLVNCTADTVAMAVCTVILCTIMMNGRVNESIRRIVILCIIEWMLLLVNFPSNLFIDVKGYGWALVLSKYMYFIVAAVMIYYFWRVVTSDYGYKSGHTLPFLCMVAFAIMLATNYFTGFMFAIDPVESTYAITVNYFAMAAPAIVLLLFTLVAVNPSVPREERLFMYFLMLLPLFGIALQVVDANLEMMGLFFLFSIIFMFGRILFRRGQMLDQQSMIMEATKMRPHFIFNSLSAIINVPGNPVETKEALLAFSGYLRSNIDFMSKSGLTTFENEMENVEAYVYLEKIRLKDRLSIEYDLKADDFILPAFSVEVLVENAIQHGISPCREGGHVRVETWEDVSHYYIRVTDDGVGYDTKARIVDQNRSHIGIDSLSERIVKMSNGNLDIHSIVDVGTVATISLPKED